ncbi:MAG: septal ring lytic transglycosylase RlpA family protein [Candidatus Nitrotoga sp.]|nr:septal ring lytic transglycosylase RlpA family protein [Candidatus Nitrotoga sp.]MDO9448215.1 septal ring lytic transglycosylase RlpA family protein [Candidatus Nitrotoga sp.]MDP3496400.1 septal ring lytic transglycosylase RlpA family protein [Candidatus Nitrotoga sp.]
MNKQTGLILFVAIILTACGSAPLHKDEMRSTPAPVIEAQTTPLAQPKRGGYWEGDGPSANAPANLDAIPNAVPRVEPLHRFANNQYTALGKTYTPLTMPSKFKERGIASWYGKKFHGKRTASGEVYDMYGMTAAHPTLPVPSYARVTNLNNKKSVVVRINDRGPFLHERIIDLSYVAAHKLGIVDNGSAEVLVEVESLVADSNSNIQTQPIGVADSIIVTSLTPAAALPVSNESATSSNVYLQLGAFRSQQSAESFLARMNIEFEGSGKHIELYQKNDDIVRVHSGPYPTQDEARAVAEKLQLRLGFKPFVVLH